MYEETQGMMHCERSLLEFLNREERILEGKDDWYLYAGCNDGWIFGVSCSVK